MMEEKSDEQHAIDSKPDEKGDNTDTGTKPEEEPQPEPKSAKEKKND